MGDSKRFNDLGLEERLLSSFDALPSDKKSSILMGLSGGLDSIVLLHLLVNIQKKRAFELSACHVHHGISPNADDWAIFCQKECKRLNIPCRVIRLETLDSKDKGIEKAAREERYQAIFRHPASTIALAHHLDDQAETFLLRLFRGSGVIGLKAMQEYQLFEQEGQQKLLWRPLLSVPRETLQVWANQHRLSWVEDESNIDTRYRRNAIRHDVLPSIQTHWPSINRTLTKTAEHCVSATLLMDDLARLDGKDILEKGFNLVLWQSLLPHRAKNVLRYWLNKQAILIASERQFEELFRQLFELDKTATGQCHFSNHQLGWYQGFLFKLQLAPNEICSLFWKGESTLHWPPLNQVIHFEEGNSDGLLATCSFEMSNRYSQHQKLRLAENRPRQSLKHHFQMARIPPWLRNRWPLLYTDDQLIGIVGLGIDPYYRATGQQKGIVISLSSFSQNP